MEPISGLKPVRDYRKMRSFEEAVDQLVRTAAESGGTALDKRAEDFRQDAIRVLGPKAFEGSRMQVLQKLEDYMKEWGLNLHSNMDKIVDTVVANPFILKLPLGRLHDVTTQSSKPKEALYDFLARAIDSLVVRVAMNKTLEEIREQQERAAAMGGMEGHPEALGVMEVVKEDLPYDSLKGYTFQWLAAIVNSWLATTSSPNSNDLRGEMEDSNNAPSFVNVPLNKKFGLLKGDDSLGLLSYDIKPLLKSMDKANTVGDVLNATFESAVLKNGVAWWANVGRYINWSSRQEREERNVPDTDEGTAVTKTLRDVDNPNRPYDRDSETVVRKR